MSDIDSMLLLYISIFFFALHSYGISHCSKVNTAWTSFPSDLFMAKIWENGVLLMTTDFNLRTY